MRRTPIGRFGFAAQTSVAYRRLLRRRPFVGGGGHDVVVGMHVDGSEPDPAPDDREQARARTAGGRSVQ